MKVSHDSGTATSEFTFVHPNLQNVNTHQQQQQMMYPAGFDTSFHHEQPIVTENLYHHIMTPMGDGVSPPSSQQNYSQPNVHNTPLAPSQRQFYQQHSYSQPELQHTSNFNMSSQSINETHIKEELEEEVTIESILEDDPLLSFTTTLDRQESNDTILQSSSPIKGPTDTPYEEIENLNLNYNNDSPPSFIKHESPKHTSIPAPMTNFPTPANSTTSTGVNSNQSPINNNHFQPQYTPQYHPQQQQFQQQHFMTTNSTVPSIPVAPDEPFVPATAPLPAIVKMETNQVPQLPQRQPQVQQQIPIQNFKMQIQNQTFFQPQFRNPLPHAQQPLQPQQVQPSLPLQQIQQVPQVHLESRPNPAPIRTVGSSASLQTIHTPVTIKSQELKLPPTPPPAHQAQPPLNKSSSTTKLSKVKKNSVSGPSTSTLKLKKSKSFLNSSPSMSKDSKPFFTTLDFSKQLNSSHNTFINKDKKFPKNAMKVNVIKNYEFVIEPGHERSKNSSAPSSAKSTPRRPSTVGTPTSTTSIKFPKLPKPPSIEKSTFSMYSPANPNSSPTNSDASGQSPLNSSQQYPYVNPSPIPSSIARFDNGDASGLGIHNNNNNNTSSPITGDQIFFRPSSSKRSSISQTSPEKHPSPPFHRDMKSGLNEFKVRTTK